MDLEIVLIVLALSIFAVSITDLIIFIIHKITKTEYKFEIIYFVLKIIIMFISFIFMISIIFFVSKNNIDGIVLYLLLFLGASVYSTINYFLSPILILFGERKHIFRTYEYEKVSFLKDYKIYISSKDFYNAYATGIIPFTKIILISQNLIDKMEKDEILAILGHEAGHLKKNHLLSLYFVSVLCSILWIISNLYFYPIYEEYSDNSIFLKGLHGGAAGYVFGYVLPTFFGYFLEYDADSYGAKMTSKEQMINALKRLDVLSNGLLSKSGLSHPILEKRIKNIEKS